MERDNRKSHLAPQLSPATQELLRSTDSPTYHGDDRTLQTPTSGEIPIVGDILSPRDQHGISLPNRSPTRPTIGSANGLGSAGSNGNTSASISIGNAGFGSLGRAGGQTVHPGLGARVATSDSVPRVPMQIATGLGKGLPGGPASAGASSNTFTLPIRPAPHPNGPLPPLPPKKESVDELRRRQQQQLQQLQLQQQQQVLQGQPQQAYQQQPIYSRTASDTYPIGYPTK